MKEQEKNFLNGMWQKVQEKEENICLAQILAEEPVKTDMASFVKEVFFGIGVKRLFSGMLDVIGIAFVVTLLAAMFILKLTFYNNINIHAAAFCSAPILYICVFLLSWLKEMQNGGLELQLSYKYTFFHVLAARMLGTSILGFAFNGIYTLALLIRYEADGIRLLAVSFSSLVLFSVLLLAGMEKGKHFLWAAACGLGFITANLLAMFLLPEWYGGLIGGIPVILLLAAGLLGFFVYLSQLLKLTSLSFRKEYTDAAN